MSDLAQVLAEARGEAALMRRRGFTQLAQALEELADAVASSAEDYLLFIPETQARLRGAKLAFLRRNYPTWEKDGHAKKVGGERHYRAIMLPRVTPSSIAREAGRRGERPDSARHAG
jgi:hypothetical protein